MHYILIYEIYIQPQLKQFWNLFKNNMFKENFYVANIKSMRLRL